eukprot:SAG11_NODE_32250_length_285_cov_0.827957_1_plen_23_part_01
MERDSICLERPVEERHNGLRVKA